MQVAAAIPSDSDLIAWARRRGERRAPLPFISEFDTLVSDYHGNHTSGIEGDALTVEQRSVLLKAWNREQSALAAPSDMWGMELFEEEGKPEVGHAAEENAAIAETCEKIAADVKAGIGEFLTEAKQEGILRRRFFQEVLYGVMKRRGLTMEEAHVDRLIAVWVADFGPKLAADFQAAKEARWQAIREQGRRNQAAFRQIHP